MGHAPSETHIFEQSAAENAGVIRDNGSRGAVGRKEGTFQAVTYHLRGDLAHSAEEHKFQECVKNNQNRDVASFRPSQRPYEINE